MEICENSSIVLENCYDKDNEYNSLDDIDDIINIEIKELKKRVKSFIIYMVNDYLKYNNNLNLTLKPIQKKLKQDFLDDFLDIKKIEIEDIITSFMIDDPDSKRMRTFVSIKVNEYEQNIIKLFNKYFDKIILSKLEEHFTYISAKLEEIDKIIVPEQRTPEWFRQRKKIISASDCYKACNSRAQSTYIDLVLKKTGIYNEYNFGKNMNTSPLIHGTITECLTQEIYETRNGVIIKEYGCLPHNKHKFIGASPDGIVHGVKDTKSLNQMSLYGRMIEIKNPYSRIINNTIKPEYKYQMIQQQEVCELPFCDFIETTIKKDYYDSLTEMLNDNIFGDRDIENIYDVDSDSEDEYDNRNLLEIIQNHNIPINNVANDGMEKGVLLHLYDEDQKIHKGVFYPLKKAYKKETIQEWIEEQRDIYSKDGFNCNEYYWKLKVYDVKTVRRDIDKWDNHILPKLTSFWNNVEKHRKMTDNKLLEIYPNKIEYYDRELLDGERKLRKIKRQNNKYRRFSNNSSSDSENEKPKIKFKF